MNSKLKSYLYNLLALVLGISLALLVGEILTRIVYPKGIKQRYPPMFEPDPDRGYRLKTGIPG